MPRLRTIRWLLAGCVVLPLAAEEAGSRITPHTRAALQALLPKFALQQSQSTTTPTATANPIVPTERDGVVIFPDYKVVEKKIAEPDPDDWLASDVVTRREMRRLEAEMTTLELLLNRWSLPVIGTSFAARARANYESQRFRNEISRVLDLAKAVEQIDRQAAQELREALDFSKLPKEKRK